MLTIRRGRRTDLTACQTLLFPDTSGEGWPKAEIRHWRRLARDPALDFYIAQQDDGLQGMLLVNYIRRLRHIGWLAVIDIAVCPSAPAQVGQALLNFAKERAQKRACLSVVWLPCSGRSTAQLPPAFFMANGFQQGGAFWSCPLTEKPEPADNTRSNTGPLDLGTRPELLGNE